MLLLYLTASFMLTYVNEYQMAQSVYILYGDSRTWLEAIIKAQVCHRHAAFIIRFELAFRDCNIIVQDSVLSKNMFSGLELSNRRFALRFCNSDSGN